MVFEAIGTARRFKISIGGLTIDVDVPAFFIVAVGLVLMYISPTLPGYLFGPDEPVPQIPRYDSGWVDGGDNKTTKEHCDPQWATYKRKHPNFNIEKIGLPEDKRKHDKSFTQLQVQQYN